MIWSWWVWFKAREWDVVVDNIFPWCHYWEWQKKWFWRLSVARLVQTVWKLLKPAAVWQDCRSQMGKRGIFPHAFSYFHYFLAFLQFFLNLFLQMGNSPTGKSPGYATGNLIITLHEYNKWTSNHTYWMLLKLLVNVVEFFGYQLFGYQLDLRFSKQNNDFDTVCMENIWFRPKYDKNISLLHLKFKHPLWTVWSKYCAEGVWISN